MKKPSLTKELILETLKSVKDPEVGIDIVTMGLIYDVEIKIKRVKSKEETSVKITMTYTTPFCPWGPQLNDEVITTLKDAFGVKNVTVEITFDPPYKMPDDLRATLGL